MASWQAWDIRTRLFKLFSVVSDSVSEQTHALEHLLPKTDKLFWLIFLRSWPASHTNCTCCCCCIACVSICESLETFGVLPALPCCPPHASLAMTCSSLPRQLCFSDVVKLKKLQTLNIKRRLTLPWKLNLPPVGAGSGYRLPSPIFGSH